MLLNPAVSNRFAIAQSKAILVSTLGSQSDAISVMVKDPSILREPDLEDMTAGQIKGRALVAQLATVAPAALLLASAAVAGGVQQGYVTLPI